MTDCDWSSDVCSSDLALAHVEVLLETRPYDVQTYREYMQWYVPRSRTRLTCPPPKRPEQVTHQERLHHSFDRHSASRRDNTVKHSQLMLASRMIFLLFVTEQLFSVTSVRPGPADLMRVWVRHPQPRSHRSGASQYSQVHLRVVQANHQEHELWSVERRRASGCTLSGPTVLTC